MTENLPEPAVRPGDAIDYSGTPSDIYEWELEPDLSVQLYPSTLYAPATGHDAEIGINGEEPMSVDDAEKLALKLLAAVRLARG